MNKYLVLILGVATISLTSCGRKNIGEAVTRGEITVMVDESLYQLIQEQVQVFEFQYRHATINILKKPEGEISRFLQDDSLRVAVLSRELNQAEEEAFASRNLIPRVTPIGFDAVALIANRADGITQIDVEEVKALLKGTSESGMNIVFENPQSSVVQFMMNFAGVESLPSSNVYSVQSSRELIDYVANNAGSIGFIGVDWLHQPTGSREHKFIGNIQVLAVGSQETGYSQPTQSAIVEKGYPFYRMINYIDAQGRAGLAMGFAAFIAGSDGQRIIARSGLVPIRFPKREIRLRRNI